MNILVFINKYYWIQFFEVIFYGTLPNLRKKKIVCFNDTFLIRLFTIIRYDISSIALYLNVNNAIFKYTACDKKKPDKVNRLITFGRLEHASSINSLIDVYIRRVQLAFFGLLTWFIVNERNGYNSGLYPERIG